MFVAEFDDALDVYGRELDNGEDLFTGLDGREAGGWGVDLIGEAWKSLKCGGGGGGEGVRREV